jgi:phosphoglycerol geranylgeranyltransferase
LTGIYERIMDGLKLGPLHVTLIDPDKQSPEKARTMALEAEEGGSDIILVGGTSGVDRKKMDDTTRQIKGRVDLPVILFPASSITLSPHADGILFMSLMNSRSVQFVNREAVMGSQAIREMGIEPIPTGYIVVEPGMLVGEVGDVSLLERDDCESAVCYALAAQYFGMKLFYLEGGSGVWTPVPAEMVREVKRTIDIPLVVGGGISNPGEARNIVSAGADIVVTGTLIEKDEDIVDSISELKRAMIEGWKGRD